MRHKLEENNRTIIRIWTSESNKQYPGNNVGHVSIETVKPKKYFSFWPSPFTDEQITNYRISNRFERKGLKYFEGRQPHYMTTYEEDFSAEGNIHPQIIICLYGLNTEKIEQTFDLAKNKISSWRLIGSNLLIHKTEELVSAVGNNFKTFESVPQKKETENCASLAYKLLQAGGIDEELSPAFYSKFSSVVTPDGLASAVIAAKKYEREYYPETIDFEFARETAVDNYYECKIL